MALSVNQPSDNSSHMNKYEQYFIEPSSQAKHGADINGSVLRSLLSSAAPRAAQVKAPVSWPRPCLPKPDHEWTHGTQVPFDSHCRIKWTWTKSAQEDPATMTVFNDHQLGTRSVVFHPQCSEGNFACFETFAAMGDRPLRKKALTYWEVEISSQALRNATSLMVGVGTKQAKRRSVGYLNLIGIDQHSWGLSNNGQLWHNNQGHFHCKPLGSHEPSKVVIGLLYDGFNGQLSFFVNGSRTGPSAAFKGLSHHEDLFPMISSTASNSHFKMGPVYESMPTLQGLCRDTITTSLSPSSWNQQLLPKSVIDFLN